MVYFPVSLNIENKRCVVAGGGRIAGRKVRNLLSAGADITLISPKLTRYLKGLNNHKKIRHIKRRIRLGDLKGAFLIIAATDNRELNKSLFKWADKRGTLINVVDSPKDCNFIMPSVLRRGHLSISVSTDGVSPALARNIRLKIGKVYDERFARYLDLMAEFRKRVIASVKDSAKRRRTLRKIASQIMR